MSDEYAPQGDPEFMPDPRAHAARLMEIIRRQLEDLAPLSDHRRTTTEDEDV